MPGHDHDHDHDEARGHGHAHGHAHGRSRETDRRRLFLALALTLLICVAEIVGGLLSNSLSLLSDAGHMVSDALGEVLAIVALSLAGRPPDQRRTFGYHRVEILMALLQGALLFTLATILIWHATHRLASPPEVHTRLMLAVAAVGLLANIVSALLLRGGHSLNVRGAYLHVVLDGLSSVAVLLVGGLLWLGETSGAPGQRPAWAARLPVLDPLLSIAIGLFIYYSAYRLCRDAVDVLMEAAPTHLPVDRLEACLHKVPGVRAVHELHVWTITSGIHALSAHIVVDPQGPGQIDAQLAAIRRALAEDFDITHSTLQIEEAACPGREAPC